MGQAPCHAYAQQGGQHRQQRVYQQEIPAGLPHRYGHAETGGGSAAPGHQTCEDPDNSHQASEWGVILIAVEKGIDHNHQDDPEQEKPQLVGHHHEGGIPSRLKMPLKKIHGRFPPYNFTSRRRSSSH